MDEAVTINIFAGREGTDISGAGVPGLGTTTAEALGPPPPALAEAAIELSFEDETGAPLPPPFAGEEEAMEAPAEAAPLPPGMEGEAEGATGDAGGPPPPELVSGEADMGAFGEPAPPPAVEEAGTVGEPGEDGPPLPPEVSEEPPEQRAEGKRKSKKG